MSKKLIIIAFIFFLTFLAQSAYAQNDQKQRAFNIALHYENKQVEIVYAETVDTVLPNYKGQPDDGYQLKLLDSENKELFSLRFNFPLRIFIDEPNGTASSQEITKTEYRIITPYFKNTAKIIVVDQEEKTVAQKNVDQVLVKPHQNPNIIQKVDNFFQKIANFIKGIFEKITSFISNIFHHTKPEENKQQTPAENPLTKGITSPQVVASNSEMVVWYYPEKKTFSVVINSKDVEGVKSRANAWFNSYYGKDSNPPKLDFVVFEPSKKTQ